MAGPKSRLAKYLFEDHKRIGDKPSGTFEGGLYTDPDGVEWYIKEAPSDDHANNEVLASKLYAEAGVKVPEVDTIRMPDGTLGVMSRKAQINRLDPDNPPPGTNEGYAADAWLANWDTAGLTYDNMYESGGEALRLDAGGALRYRAQGAPKGRFFGDTPGELDTLRDEDMNPQSSRLFRNVTDEQIKTKADQIREIPESRIKELVELYGPEGDKEGLVKTLLARRSNLPAIAATLGVGGASLGASEESEAGVGSGIGRYARDQYRDLDLYHGSPNWKEGEIDLSHAQRGASGDGFYTTVDPDEASKYAGGGPVWSVKDQAPLEADAGAQVLPLLMRKDALIFDYHGNPDQVVPEDIANDVVINLGEYGLESDFRFDGDTTVAKLADYLNETGADDRVVGEVLGQSGFDATRNGDHIVFRNPSALKGRFAKFEGPGLMGGAAGAAAVGGGIFGSPDAMASENLTPRIGDQEKWQRARQASEDRAFVGRLSRDRGDLYGPEREWAVAGAEAVQNLPGGEFAPFMDQVRKWGWGDQMQPTDYAMMALDATDFIPGAAAIGLPAKRMAKQATEEAIQSRLMAGEAVEELSDADYGAPLYQEGEVGFDLQGLIDDILKESSQKGSEDLAGNAPNILKELNQADQNFLNNNMYQFDNTPAPNSLNSMFASAAKQLGQDPGRLMQKNIDKSVPMSALDFDDQYIKIMDDLGYTGQPEDLVHAQAQEVYLKAHKWFKQETGQNLPHPYDLTDMYGPGVMHIPPPQMFEFLNEIDAFGGLDPGKQEQLWKENISEYWANTVDKGNADPKNWSSMLPPWYTYPNGKLAGVGGVDGAPMEIFQPFHDELAAKGLASDPQSRLQRAQEHGFRFKFDTPMQPHHVTGGHFNNFDPVTGQIEDASDLTHFKSSRGPMGSFVSVSPYDLTESALQSEDKYRRSYPVGIQGRMFAFDEPEEWFMPKEINLPDPQNQGRSAERLYNAAIAPNIPLELQDFLHDKGWNAYMRNLWTSTAGNRYAPSPDDPTKMVYQGPASVTKSYNPDYVPGSGSRFDPTSRTEEYTFTAPFEPPHFLTFEDYTRNNDGDITWPYQEIIQQMGYKASKVDDEAGWSIAARPINKRSLFANFDPDRMEGGSNPTTNIMAGLGLTAVSLPAIMAELTGDDEDGYWAGLLQKQMSGNGYD